MNLVLLQVGFRLVLAIVAMVHFAEGALPKKGVTWRLPFGLHAREASPVVATFLFAFLMMIVMDLEWTPAFLLPDIGLLVLVEFALLVPPVSAVSRDGIRVPGLRCSWNRYLEHDADPLSGDLFSVRLRYRTWKFMSTVRFTAPERAVKALGSKGRPQRTRERGWWP